MDWNMIREKSERIRSGVLLSLGEPLTVIHKRRVYPSQLEKVRKCGSAFPSLPTLPLDLALTLLFSPTLPFPAPYPAVFAVFLLLSILLHADLQGVQGPLTHRTS